MLSAVIITLNEAHNLARCLRSLQGLADEIIVVDSNSTDETAAIAESFGAKVYNYAFDGYGAQKARAVSLAAYRWVLNIDADEEVSPLLKENLLAVLASPQAAAYRMPRLTNYCGAWIRHCGWYPDYVLRLWDKERGYQNDDKVHESWVLNNAADKVGALRGDLFHYSFPTISSHFKKIEHYSEQGARFDVARGKKASLLKLAIAPQWEFLRNFIFRGGFLDGYYGWVICRNSAFASWAKYLKIRQYTKLKEQGLGIYDL